MTPFERFKNTITNGNLWIYILILSKENHLQKSKVESLVFEKFGFLPKKIMTQIVLKKLETGGYIKKGKFQGEKSYIITEKGGKELEKLKNFYKEIIEKV